MYIQHMTMEELQIRMKLNMITLSQEDVMDLLQYAIHLEQTIVQLEDTIYLLKGDDNE